MKLLGVGLEKICAADKTAAGVIESRFDAVRESLAVYIREIERFNSAYGLVKVSGRDGLIVKHMLDSLSALGHIVRLAGNGRAIADLGSGAGLPGVPLALCLPEYRFTLIERMGKRAGFLRNVAAVLKPFVSNIVVEEAELEKVPPSQFNLVTFRALSPLEPDFVEKALRLLKTPRGPEQGGIIAAYKGRTETAEAELAGLASANGSPPSAACSTELVPLSVPFLDEQRCLAVIRLAAAAQGSSIYFPQGARSVP